MAEIVRLVCYFKFSIPFCFLHMLLWKNVEQRVQNGEVLLKECTF